MKKKTMPSFFAVAFVWFTTHFGGGFASGAQLNSFFIKFGPWSLIMPVLSQLLLAVTFFFVWKYAMDFGKYDYRSWTDSFYHPAQGVMSNAYDLIYNVTLIIATAVAFATGGATLEKVFGTPYLLNTVIIAVAIFLLTVFGASMVRRAATVIAIAIIVGMIVMFVPNIITFMPQLMQNISELKSLPSSSLEGLWPAAWSALLYAGFQACAVGAYISHAQSLKDGIDIKKAAVWGFVINGGLMFITTLGLLSFYGPDLVAAKVPTLVVVQSGVGSGWMVPIVSILIILGAVSTGVNLVYGIVNRIVMWLGRNENTDIAVAKQKNRSFVVSTIYIAVTWCVAQFGLIPLIAKGYGSLGKVAIVVILIPVLVKGFIGWKKPTAEEQLTPNERLI